MLSCFSLIKVIFAISRFINYIQQNKDENVHRYVVKERKSLGYRDALYLKYHKDTWYLKKAQRYFKLKKPSNYL